MEDSPNKRAIIVGIFVLVGLLFLTAGILAIGNIRSTFTKKMHVTAIFDNVNGLQAGNNVWFSGVKIGTVRNLDFYGKSQVKVVLSINSEIQEYIRKDAKVKISTDGLIGNKIVEIYGGSSLLQPVTEGDTLGVEKALSTEQMMATFQENNKNVLEITNDLKTISKKLSKGEGTIGKLLTDETVYNNITNSTASLEKASGKAQQAMASVENFTSKLHQKGTLANDLVTDTTVFRNIKASSVQLHRMADSASAAVNSLKRASTNTESPVGVLLYDKQSGTHLKSTLQNLDSGSKKLDENMEAAQHNFLLRGFFKKKEKEQAKSQKK